VKRERVGSEFSLSVGRAVKNEEDATPICGYQRKKTKKIPPFSLLFSAIE
jgi:hypothetical protein